MLNQSWKKFIESKLSKKVYFEYYLRGSLEDYLASGDPVEINQALAIVRERHKLPKMFRMTVHDVQVVVREKEILPGVWGGYSDSGSLQCVVICHESS